MKITLVRVAVLTFLLGVAFRSFSLEHVLRSYDPAKDYDAVSQLCRRYWQELGEVEETCSVSLDKELYQLSKPEQASQEHLYAKVVEVDGTAVGFAIYKAQGAGGAENFDALVKRFWQFGSYDRDSIALFDKKVAYLFYIAVHPDYQSKGYGKLLLGSISSDLKEKGFVTLLSQVEKSNSKALSWHEKQGFKAHKPEHVYSILEEISRLTAQSLDRELMHLDLVERTPDSFLGLDFMLVRESLLSAFKKKTAQEQYITKVQLALAQDTARRFSSQVPWSLTESQKIALRYFVRYFNREEIYEFASWLLKEKPLTKTKKRLVTKIMDSINGYAIKSPEDLKKFDFLKDITL